MEQRNTHFRLAMSVVGLTILALGAIGWIPSQSPCFAQTGTLPPLTTPAASPAATWTPSNNTAPSTEPVASNETLRPIRVEDVVAMNRAGIDETVMGDQIRRQGFEGILSIDDLILLKQENVPTSVVRELQLAAPGSRAFVARPAASQTASSPTPYVQERSAARPAPTVIYQTPPPAVVRPHYYYSYPSWHCTPHGCHPPVRIHSAPALQFHFRF